MIPTRMHQSFMKHKFGGFIMHGSTVFAVVYAPDCITKHRLCDVAHLDCSKWQLPKLNSKLTWIFPHNTALNVIFYQHCNTPPFGKQQSFALSARYETPTSIPLDYAVNNVEIYSQTKSIRSEHQQYTYYLFDWRDTIKNYCVQPRLVFCDSSFHVHVLPVAGVEVDL